MELSDPSTKLYWPDVSVAGAQVTPVIDSGISLKTQDITWSSLSNTLLVAGVIVAAEIIFVTYVKLWCAINEYHCKFVNKQFKLNSVELRCLNGNSQAPEKF